MRETSASGLVLLCKVLFGGKKAHRRQCFSVRVGLSSDDLHRKCRGWASICPEVIPEYTLSRLSAVLHVLT